MNAAMQLFDQTYLIFKPLQKNCRFLIPTREVQSCLKRCLAFAASESTISVHDHFFLPHGTFLIVSAEDAESDIPEFMGRFCNDSWRFLNKIFGRVGPIWAKYKGQSYKQEPLLTESAVLAAHAMIRLESYRLGYSKNNNIFGGMVLPLKNLGQLKKTRYRRPAEAKKYAKIPKYSSMNHCLSPLLRKLGKKVARRRIKQLILKGRRLIDKERKKRKISNFEEHGILVFRNRDTPRTTKEKRRRAKYEVQFDYDRLLKSVERKKNNREKEKFKELERAFQRQYRQALDAWSRGLYDQPFPVGTYKMVKCFSAASEPVKLL